jgi:hypothetical protein
MIMNCDMTVPEGDEPAVPKLPQDPVHVNRTQTQGIGEVVLRQRTVVPFLAAHADQHSLDPSSSRKCAMRASASRRPIPTRCSTTIASSRDAAQRMAVAKRGVCANASNRSLTQDFGGLDRPRWARSCGPRCARARCAGPGSHRAPGNPRSGAFHRVVSCRSRPIRRQNVGSLIRLPLVHHVRPAPKERRRWCSRSSTASSSLRQGDKGREFAGQGAVLC